MKRVLFFAVLLLSIISLKAQDANNYGIKFSFSQYDNLTIKNSNITNNTFVNIWFNSSFTNNNASFQNNYLGSWSLVFADDWNNQRNATFYNNTYLSGTVLHTCFDYPINLTCENAFPIIIPESTPINSQKILPVYGLFSMILTYILLFGYFIFN